MAQARRGGPVIEAMSDDALINRGAECENRLAQIAAEAARLRPAVDESGQALRRPAVKLALNAGIGLAGIAAAFPTAGWSLLVTDGSAGMLLWDGIDFGRDLSRNRALRQPLRALRNEAARLERELREINAVLDERYPHEDG